MITHTPRSIPIIVISRRPLMVDGVILETDKEVN